MQSTQLLDLYFIDARSKLIDIAAFLDRIERADGSDDDFRLRAFHQALSALAQRQVDGSADSSRAEEVLLAFSDPTTEPIERAGCKGATGAWPGKPVVQP